MNVKYISIFFISILSLSLQSYGQVIIEGKSEPVEFFMLPSTDEDKPPDLFLHIAFVDENNNGILEATESAELILTIFNGGQGRAEDLSINLDFSTHHPELKVKKTTHNIPALFPEGIATISFPIKAGKQIRTMTHKAQIIITEKKGYNFEVVNFEFTTKAYQPPRLEYIGMEILSPEDNSPRLVRAGEKVKLNIQLQNTGKGIARNVNYNVYTRTRGLSITNGEGHLTAMGFGDIVEIPVLLDVSRGVSLPGKLPIYLTVTVAENTGGITSFQLPIEFERPTQMPNPKNLGHDLADYTLKYATFNYTSSKINARIGAYLPPLFTYNIVNATSRGSGGGYIVPSDFNVLSRGVCWTTTPNPTTENNHTIDGAGAGPYRSLLTGLEPSTTYYARAYATYESGTIYGNQISFTTLELPVVNTITVSNIGATIAVSGGRITSDGGSPITERGVCWSRAPEPTVTRNKMTSGTGTGEFSTRITMLNANTTYYVRAYAINAAGVAYGEQMSFTTLRACDGITNFVYEGQNYNTIEIGNQCWMKENLNVGSSTNDGSSFSGIEKYCYDDVPNNCVLFDGLYGWEEMMKNNFSERARGICPEGWHIPSLAEWNTLISFFGGESVAGAPVKRGGASGFEALAGGMRGTTGGYSLLGSGAYFWTSTQIDQTNAWSVTLLFRGTAMSPTSRSKVSGLSVRCVKD